MPILANKKLKKVAFWLAAIFVLAILLRLSIINTQDLWADEAFSVNAAREGLSRSIEISVADTNPPLHLLILSVWGGIFGFGEIAMRFTSLIFGIASLFVLLKIAQELKLTNIQKIFTALLFAVSPVLIYYSVEARAYALLTLLFLSALYLLLRIKRQVDLHTQVNPQTDFWKLLLLFQLSNLLGLYTHNIFIFPFIILNLALGFQLIRGKHFATLKQFLLSFFPTIILYLPWLLIFAAQLSKVSNKGFWFIFEPFNSIWIFWANIFVNTNINPEVLPTLIVLIPIILILGSIFLLMGSVDSWRKRNGFIEFIYLAILLLVYLISFRTALFYIRYLVFLVPVILLTMVKPLGLVGGRGKSLLTALFFLLTASLLSFQIFNVNTYTTKPETKLALQYIDSNSNSAVVLNFSGVQFHATKYYLAECNCQQYLFTRESELRYYEGLASIQKSDYFQGDLSSLSDLWIIKLYWEDATKNNESLAAAGFRIADSKSFSRTIVEKWSKK